MAIEKNFDFEYSAKTKKVVDGKETEVKEKKNGTAVALQFDSVADILAYFEAKEAGKGEELLIKEINDSFKNTAIANKRAELTRVPVVPKSLVAKAQANLDANDMANFLSMMDKLGLKVDGLTA